MDAETDCPRGHFRVFADSVCAHERVSGTVDLLDADEMRWVGDDTQGWLGECWSPDDRHWSRAEVADEYGPVIETDPLP